MYYMSRFSILVFGLMVSLFASNHSTSQGVPEHISDGIKYIGTSEAIENIKIAQQNMTSAPKSYDEKVKWREALKAVKIYPIRNLLMPESGEQVMLLIESNRVSILME
jgi:hypothetical protein